MTSEKFGKILLSIYEHAVFLKKRHWKTGNHAVGEVAALGIVTIFFSELKEATKWRQYCIDFLMGMWDKQFHVDYYTNEMSGGYHWVAMRSYFAFYEVGKKNGYGDLFPKLYVDRLIQASYAELYQNKPDYSIPITNDSSSKTNRKEQLERIYKLFKLEEINYRLSEGAKGKKPAHTSYFFQEARVGIMRNDWTKKSNYLFFDMGRWDDNHMNEDQLNLELSAYGRNILINCGRWRYITSPGVDWLSEARYFKTTRAYNTLMVDGHPQLAGDAQGYMLSNEEYDFAEGTFSEGYGSKVYIEDKDNPDKTIEFEIPVKITNVKHKRQIIFVKPLFYIVTDVVETPDEREAELIFHYREGNVVKEKNTVFTQFEDIKIYWK